MFDKYYMNQTTQFFSSLNPDGSPQLTFRSESSEMFIGICHGYTALNFTLDFFTEGQLLEGLTY